MRHLRVCLCVYVCVRAHARLRMCTSYTHSFSHIVFACAFHYSITVFSTWQSLEQEAAVLHRAHTSGFCSALEQWPHSVALLLSLSAAASSVLGIWCLWAA